MSPTQSVEEAALVTYEAMWGVLVEESTHADPDYSGLGQYASGEALELVQYGLGVEAGEGVVARGEPTFSPEVVSIDEEYVEILDCMDSTSWLREDIDSGELVEPSPEPEEQILRKIDAGVSFDGLVWKVSDLRIWEAGSC